MTEYMLKAERREESGKGSNRRLRRDGKVPAVIYGAGTSELVTLDSRELERLLGSGAAGKLVELELKAGRSKQKLPTLIKEVQVEPIKGLTIHVDFLKVDMHHAVTTKIPVHFVGEERRMNDGALIEHLLREVEISCLPDRIPEGFEADVSALAAGHSLYVRDLKPAEGITVLTPGEEVLAIATIPHHAAPAEESKEGVEAEAKAGEPAAEDK